MERERSCLVCDGGGPPLGDGLQGSGSVCCRACDPKDGIGGRSLTGTLRKIYWVALRIWPVGLLVLRVWWQARNGRPGN